MMYRTFYVYENYLDGPFFLPKIEGTRLKIIEDPDYFEILIARGYEGFSSMKGGLDRLRRKTGDGAVAFCVFVNRELASIVWISLNEEARKKVDPFPIPIDWESEALTGSSRTKTKYLGKGLYIYSMSEIFKYLKKEGKDKCKFTIEKNNVVPHYTLMKLNSKIIGSGYHVKFILDSWLSIIGKDIQINIYRG